MQQKCILIGLELNAILSAHSGPPQYPEVKTKTVGMVCVCVSGSFHHPPYKHENLRRRKERYLLFWESMCSSRASWDTRRSSRGDW